MKIRELLTENDAEHRQELQKTGFWGKRGAGCLFLALDTGRICIAHRSQYVEQPNTWGTWGGAIDSNESPEDAVQREAREEAGYTGSMKLVPLYVFKHSSGFTYYNFLALVETEFTPKLDWETQGYKWIQYPAWPEPLHMGMKLLLADPHSVEVISKYSEPKFNTLNEIETIPGKEYNPHANEFEMYSGDIEDYKHRMKPLPGNSGLTYVVVNMGGQDRAIYILDPNNLKYLVGELKLEYQGGIPNNTLQAALVRVHPKYRGRGIAKALYGLALLPKPEGLGLTIVSDTTQTPGGVRNWVSLSKIPGVEVTGVVAIPVNAPRLPTSPDTQAKYEKLMTDLLGEVGGFYLSENMYYYFYQIPVDLVGSKLENTIKSSLIKMYFKPPIDYLYHTFLMAKYGSDNIEEAKKRKRKQNRTPRSITTGWWGGYYGDNSSGGDGGGGE